MFSRQVIGIIFDKACSSLFLMFMMEIIMCGKEIRLKRRDIDRVILYVYYLVLIESVL